MGLNTSVHVGYYVEAKMSMVTGSEDVRVCEKNIKHKNDFDAKFCSKCGGKIITAQVDTKEYRTFSHVQWEEYKYMHAYYPTEGLMSEDDYNWLRETFELIPSEWIGNNKEGYEILVIRELNDSIDADSEGMYDLPEHTLDPATTIEMINRLKKVMQYEEAGIAYGVLVSVA